MHVRVLASRSYAQSRCSSALQLGSFAVAVISPSEFQFSAPQLVSFGAIRVLRAGFDSPPESHAFFALHSSLVFAFAAQFVSVLIAGSRFEAQQCHLQGSNCKPTRRCTPTPYSSGRKLPTLPGAGELSRCVAARRIFYNPTIMNNGKAANSKQLGMLILGIFAVVLCLLYPRLKRDQHFPYTGIWSGFQPGTPMQITVSFDDKGECAVRYTGTRGYTEYSCSYKMNGQAAILTTKLRKENAQGSRIRVLAQNSGKTLTYQLIGSKLVSTLNKVSAPSAS